MFNPNRLGAMRKAIRQLRKTRDGASYTTHFNKTEIDAALQALETRLVSSKSVLSSDIEGAAPGVFTPLDKLYLVAEAMQEFVLRELGRTRR